MVAGVEQSLNSTVQLALHCVRWGNSAPKAEGELAWEECFVGPLVSHTFEDLFGADSDPEGVSVAWKGCVCFRVLQPPVDAHSRCPVPCRSDVHVSPGQLSAMPLWDTTRTASRTGPAVSSHVKPDGVLACAANPARDNLPNIVALVKETRVKQHDTHDM